MLTPELEQTIKERGQKREFKIHLNSRLQDAMKSTTGLDLFNNIRFETTLKDVVRILDEAKELCDVMSKI